MADLTLRINSDYSQASKAFKELANESEATREKIEKFSNSFQSENINKFIDKQKLLEASLTGTRGGVAAMTTAQKNYEKEIEKLIRSGLDPESDAVKKLRDEHDKLADKIKETNEVQKKQEELMKGAEKAALGMVAAIGAGVAAVGVATQKTAEAGNQFAKTSRVIGMTAETFQELDYAAKMSGIDNLDSSLQKLNKSVADVKNDTGTLTSYLKENDTQLLNQLKNVNSNEEAFNLLMDAIGKAPDEFTRAELAQAAFGKSGQQLILLANEGADGIANLREEARKYGVISNEAAANSEAYLDAQARLKAALTGVTTELVSGLMPGLTETITKIADFIAGIDDWEKILTIAGYTLAGVTAGLVAFLAVTKGAALIHGLATAFKALTAAMAANPLGVIAVLVTAVLIPALIALYKNWDKVQTYLQQGIARIKFAFQWLGSVIQEGLVVAFNAVKIAAATLIDFIHGNIIRGVGKLLEVMGKLPFVGELFQKAAEKVNGLGNAIHNIAEETKRESREAIQAAHDKQDATQAELENTLATIDAESRAKREALKAQEDENKSHNESMLEAESEFQQKKSDIETAALENSKEKQKEQEKFEKDLAKAKVNFTSDMFGALSDLAEMGAKDNIGMMILSKAAAAAQAAINSYLAFTQVLADPMTPAAMKPFVAGSILLSGLVQQAKIIATAIPSAETGGRFIVPNSVGSDNTLMKVNKGEEVNVTPRGLAGLGQTMRVIVQMEKQVLFDYVNEGISSGDIIIANSNY
jgi:hypothetical protein